MHNSCEMSRNKCCGSPESRRAAVCHFTLILNSGQGLLCPNTNCNAPTIYNWYSPCLLIKPWRKGTKCGRKITSWKLLWNSLNDKLFSYTCEVIKCKDQKPGEKMGLIQRSMRSRDPWDPEIQRSMRSRDQNRHQPVDPEQEIDQWSHKREELHNLWRKKSFCKRNGKRSVKYNKGSKPELIIFLLQIQ